MTCRTPAGRLATLVLAAVLATGCGGTTGPPPPVVVAVSDVHFNPFHDPLLFPELLAAPASDWAGILGRHGSADPGHFGATTNFVLLQRSLAAVRDRNPSFVVFGGDLLVQQFRTFFFAFAPGGDEAALRAFQLKAVTFVVGQVRAALGTTPVYFTLGNWDSYGGSFALQPDDPFLADTATLFRETLLLGSADAATFDATYRSGGHYVATAPGGDVVVGLNSIFLAPQAPQGIEAAVERELDWLETTLDAVRASGRRAWLVTHVPPGGDLATTGTDVDPQGHIAQPTMLLQALPQERLLAILGAHRDVVRGAFTGHTHMDEYRLAGIPLQGIPGITSDMGNAPAFKVFTIGDDSSLEDYVSWWLDLSSASAAFQPYYDFESAYGLGPPLGPSQETLFPALDLSAAARSGYQGRYGSGHAPEKPITDLNWPVYWCGIAAMTSEGLAGCVNQR